tara:strand:+ start:711 stop:890 length:180 start_codon:yes stop_codon:yes gene_type:complete
MKVGDLVELSAYKNVIGLIVGVQPNVKRRWRIPPIFNVLIDGSIHPFRSDMLEVISESR